MRERRSDAVIGRRLARRARLVLGLSLALVAWTCVVGGQRAYAASAKVSVLQFNLCSTACGTGNAVISDLESVIRSASPRPLVLMLNEMCLSGYAQLRRDLPGYKGVFRTTISHRCADGSDYGDAVLVASPTFTTLGTWALPRPDGGEYRQVSCLRTSVPGASRPLVACGTHVDFKAGNNGPQTASVATRTGAYVASDAVVVGGDFNATPTSGNLDVMYTSAYPGGRGRFVEADSTNLSRVGGSATSLYNQFTGCGGASCPSSAYPARRKIDYVFLSGGAFADVSSRTYHTAHSDHMPVVATFAVR